MAHRIGVIADDSMLGRDTPSRGLELTARYVANQFRRFGLRPGGDRGGWFQRYAIARRRFDVKRSRVVLEAGGVEAAATFDRTARYLQGAVSNTPLAGPAVLVGGTLDPADVSRVALQDKVVLYVTDFAAPPTERTTQVTRAIRLAGPKAVLLVANLPPDGFAARIPRSMPARTTVDLKLVSPPIVEVEATAGGARAPRRPGESRGRSGRYRPGHPGPAWVARAGRAAGFHRSSRSRRPIPWGFSRAAIPTLKNEYLVFSAHMDHIGITPGPAGQHQQWRRRRRLGHGRRDGARRGVQPAGRAAEAVDHLPDGERRGEGALGQPLLQRAPARCRSTRSSPTSTST